VTIHKKSAEELIGLCQTYDVVPRQSVQSIRNSAALAIFTHLLTKPENWVIREQQIMDYFDDIGRRRYRAAIRELKSLGLIENRQIRDKKTGQLRGGSLELHVIPSPESNVIAPSVTESNVIHQSDNPPCGERDPVKRQRLLKETESIKKGKCRSQRSRDRSLDDDLTDTSWAH
jgi:hypothetical protein